MSMPISLTRITSQGQVSVPASIRKKLSLGPGSILEWEEKGGVVVVRRAGRYSSTDIHKVLFPSGIAEVKTPPDTKDAIRQYIRKRHAGR